MKKLILLVTLLIQAYPVWSQSNPPVRGNQFQLTGKIIQPVTMTPHCGTLAWGTVVEFKILQYSDQTYHAAEIPVIFTCPEFYPSAFFKTGGIYTLTIADENQADFDWIIPNASILDQYALKKKLWVIHAARGQ